MKLDDALQSCTLALLRKIAVSHGLAAPDDALRAELAEHIAEKLRQLDYLPTFLQGLPEIEITILRAVRDAGWEQKSFVIERLAERRTRDAGLILPPGEPPASRSLLQKGLLFRSFATATDRPGEVYVVPFELRPMVEAAIPATFPSRLTEIAPAAAPTVIHESRPAHDMFALLSYLRRVGGRSIHGTMARGDLLKLDQEVWQPAEAMVAGRWEEKWRFLLHLGLAGGWVRRMGNRFEPGRTAWKLLSGTHRQVADRLLNRYLRDRGWSDLRVAGKVRQVLGNRPVDEVAARGLLIGHLREITGQEWTSEDDLCEALQAMDPDFLREDFASPSWGMVDQVSGIELFGPESWDQVEGEWVRSVLRGPFHWLGVVQWGSTRDGGEAAFRLLPTADEDVTPNQPSRPHGGFSLDEELGVSVSDEIDFGYLFRLEPYAEIRRQQGRQLYRLTRESIAQGIEKGGSWDELREVLGKGTSDRIPPLAAARLRGWVAEHGRYTLETAVLLVSSTPEDAEKATEIPGLRAYLHSRLGPKSFKVLPGRVWDLVLALKAAGHLPQVDRTVPLQLERQALAQTEALKECLFALRLQTRLHPETAGEAAAGAVRILEATLDPADVVEVARRVEEAEKKVQGRS